jgi:hypothetical protein
MNSIYTDIERAKEKLIKRALRIGIKENFGQAEVRAIQSKWQRLLDSSSDVDFSYIESATDAFYKWCLDFDEYQLRKYR